MNLKKKLRKFFALNRKSDGGFTLVELIVVIAILAILAGVAVPAYSGYVEKANEAADEALLNEINTAFAAACLNNGENNYFRTDDPTITLDDGVAARNALNTANDNVDASFEGFFEGGEFKVFQYLKYDGTLGMFLEGNEVYNKILEKLIAEHGGDIQKLAASIFDDAGMGELMGKVDYAAALAAAIVSEDETGSSKLTDLLLSPANLETLSQMMGYGEYVDADGNVNPEFEAALDEIIYDRAALLAAENGGDVESWYEQASADVMSNNAVLIAATSSNFDTNAFMDTLAAGNGKSSIISTMSTDTQTALSQAALAYAMYTSYAARNDIDTSNVDVATVLDALSSEDTSEGSFRHYMSTEDATTDMEGYLASMNMLDASAKSDPEAISNLLVNGFADPDLVAMLQQAASSAS